MSKFFNALARIGLVEIEDRADDAPAEDLVDDKTEPVAPSREVATTPKADSAVAASTASPRRTPAVSADLVEGTPFAQVYQAAAIAPSPFPAEKLLRVLDGLRAMDPAMRRAAVTAIDAADDTWTVDDPINDAARKIKALDEHKLELASRVAKLEVKTQTALEEQTAYQTEATATIRKQIADLETLLQQEVQKVASDCATIQARIEANRQACARESARLDLEMARLREIARIFAKGKSDSASG